MHAAALTKRLREKDPGTKLTINACHPGAVNTTICRMPIYQDYLRHIFAPLLWFIFKTAQDGAQTPLFLALSKKVTRETLNFCTHKTYFILNSVYNNTITGPSISNSLNNTLISKE
jgi:hypothetical protein